MNTTTANAPRVELEIVRGQARQRQRPINVPAFLIGASRDCDLVLGDPNFGDVHAYLIVHSSGVSIRHLGCGPSMFVNGHEVLRSPLHDGDRVRTGPYEFVVHVADRASKDCKPSLPASFPARTWATNAQDHEARALQAAHQLLSDIRAALHNDPKPLRRPA